MLGNVCADQLKSFILNIDTPMLTPAFREDLVKTIKQHKGSIPLEIYFYDPGTRYRIQFKSNKYQVEVSEEFITALRHLGIDQVEAVKR